MDAARAVTAAFDLTPASVDTTVVFARSADTLGLNEADTVSVVALTSAGDSIMPGAAVVDAEVVKVSAQFLSPYRRLILEPVASGATKVIASLGSARDTFDVVVDPDYTIAMSFQPDSVHLGVIGDQSEVVAALVRANGDTAAIQHLTATSSDPSIGVGFVEIAEKTQTFRVTALEFGAASVSVSTSPLLGLSSLPVIQDSFPVVAASLPVGVVTITPDSVSILKGESTQLSVELRDLDGNIVDRPVTWRDVSPSSGGIEVSAAGVVTGLSEGSYLVEAESETVADTAKVVVVGPDLSDPYQSIRLFGRWIACMVNASAEAFCVDLQSETTPSALPGNLSLQHLGGGSLCGVTVSGVGYCWPDGATNAPVELPGSAGLVQIEEAPDGVCGLTTTGDIVCWQFNAGSGQYTGPTQIGGSHQYASLASGIRAPHGCAITVSGDAYCWGSNTGGQLGDGTTVAAPSDAPVLVTGGHVWADLTTGQVHTCGVTTSGELYCWGSNPRGQVAVGTGSGDCGNLQFFDCTPEVTQSSVPLSADTNETFVAGSLSSDDQGSCALGTDGNGYCWGNLGALGGIPGGWSPTVTAVGPTYTEFTGSLFARCGLDGQGDAWCTTTGNNPFVLPPP